MNKPSKEDLRAIASAKAADVAIELGQEFATWLSKRPRIAKLPRLAKFLFAIGSRK